MDMSNKVYQVSSGFTLVELAMVLFVISLVLGGILGPLSTRIEGGERNKTTVLLNEARDSLIGFAMVNGHLPCPDCPDATGVGCGGVSAAVATDINDGTEDGVAADDFSPVPRPNFVSCATSEGNLPWATLGVNEFDAWGNHFIYRVDQTFADDTDGTAVAGCSTAAGISFQICSVGDITINDYDNDTGYVVLASKLPALVISYGKNVDDADNPSSDFEQENQDTIAPFDTADLFIDKDYSNVPAVEFDDMLIWIPTNFLIYKMVQAERLP
ncbi:MAG: type II secretory pathway pseudopilin PulG [Gammaproteobacteria bacterium]